MVQDLNERSREIFRHIVDTFMETGEPVGSRTISKLLEQALSPATIRNVMADLEETGLLYSPHTSAGRLPTSVGMRLFVDGILEIGDLAEEERASIQARCEANNRSVESLLEEAGNLLSGLSGCAGLVMAPKADSPLKHIEFISLSPGRAMAVLITENGLVENRILEVPTNLPPSALVEASNFLSARLVGRTIHEAESDILDEIRADRAELDALTARVVEDGLATWGGGEIERTLIVRGQSKLLTDVTAVADLERIRKLFIALETKETMANLLNMADRADGVQIFIGSDSDLFGVSGCSMIVGPYKNESKKVVGAIGVIGPTRINYARIIPMVDYTAKVVGRMIG